METSTQTKNLWKVMETSKLQATPTFMTLSKRQLAVSTAGGTFDTLHSRGRLVIR